MCIFQSVKRECKGRHFLVTSLHLTASYPAAGYLEDGQDCLRLSACIYSILAYQLHVVRIILFFRNTMHRLCGLCRSYGMWSDPDADKSELVLEVHPPVSLDTSRMGDEVVVIKNGSRLCGSGGCIATASIVQDKAYYEVKIQRDGQWGVGLSLGNVNVNTIPFGANNHSWVLREDGNVYHNNQVLGTVPEVPRENDVIGIAYDHVELSFHLNGKPLNTAVRGPKGTVFPSAFVDKDAILDFYFCNFQFAPPSGFTRIMYEQTIL